MSGKPDEEEPRPKGDIRNVFGLLRQPGREPLSIEEMNRIIELGWAGLLDTEEEDSAPAPRCAQATGRL
ncbi:MAG: hypothetical protein U1E45_07540 [Geminicoccaceae bacterium]